MTKKWGKSIITVFCAVVAAVGFVGCGKSMSASQYEDYEKVSATNYNQNLFYLNEMNLSIADPSVIYVEQGEEAGWFYAYGTSDEIDNRGFQCWRSRDMAHWEYKSIAFLPQFGESFSDMAHWAPEVLYDEADDLYYMFYNAMDDNDGKFYLSVATSENPYGPFVQPDKIYNANGEYLTLEKAPFDFYAESNPRIAHGLESSNTIDAHAFVDPVSGKKYLYWSQTFSGKGQCIVGCEMKDWFSPDYSTVKLLAIPNYTKVSGGDSFDEDTVTMCNEGPFMLYEDGTYYLTFSIYGYTNPMYQVRQAVAAAPLGDFEKLLPEDGGQVLYADFVNFGNITSVGHHSFIRCGDQVFIAYHTFKNRETIDDGRSLAIDEIKLYTMPDGKKVLRANGPTYSYQPLPAAVSGYSNLAAKAKVSADNTAADSDVSFLTDGLIRTTYTDPVQEYAAKKGKSEIEITFDDYITARAVMVYNTIEYEKSFTKIDTVELTYLSDTGKASVLKIKDIPFDAEWHSAEGEVIFPGASSIIEFSDLPVKKIKITVNSVGDSPLSIAEIAVLGKEVVNPAPVKEIEEYSYENETYGAVMPVYESRTFGGAGSAASGYGFDFTHDDGTENAYIESVVAGASDPAYFKDIVSVNFYVEAEISVLTDQSLCWIAGEYPHDPYPRIGIYVKDAVADDNDTKQYLYWHLMGGEDYTGKSVLLLHSNTAGTDLDWTDYLSDEILGLNYKNGNFAKLAVARLGGEFRFYCNDELIFTVQDGDMYGFSDGEDTASAVGFYAINSLVRWKNYSIVTDIDDVKQKIDSLAN